MYKFILIFFAGLLSAQQCRISFSNSSILDNGNVIFIIENLSNKKIKLPNQFPEDFANKIDIQVYNEMKKDYENSTYSFSEATCLNIKDCFGKMIYLKKGRSKKYNVKIIPGRITKAFKEKKKYRFKLAFSIYFFTNCKEYITDWLYYDNSNN